MLLYTLTTALLAGRALAVGHAMIINDCNEDVYVSSIPATGPIGIQDLTIPPGTVYTEEFGPRSIYGGIALKIRASWLPGTSVPAPGTGSPAAMAMATVAAAGAAEAETIFAYTYDEEVDTVWFDLNTVYGDAFAGRGGLAVKPTDITCGSIIWPEGTNPGGVNVKQCGAAGDITLSLCSVE